MAERQQDHFGSPMAVRRTQGGKRREKEKERRGNRVMRGAEEECQARPGAKDCWEKYPDKKPKPKPKSQSSNPKGKGDKDKKFQSGGRFFFSSLAERAITAVPVTALL